MNKKGLIIAGIVAVLAIAGGTTCYFMFNKPVTTGTETTTTSTGETNANTTVEIMNLEMPNVEYKTTDELTSFMITKAGPNYMIINKDGELPKGEDFSINFLSEFVNGKAAANYIEGPSDIIDENGNPIHQSKSLWVLSHLGKNFIGYRDFDNRVRKESDINSTNTVVVIVNENGDILKNLGYYGYVKSIGDNYEYAFLNYVNNTETTPIIIDENGNEILKLDKKYNQEYSNAMSKNGIIYVYNSESGIIIDAAKKEIIANVDITNNMNIIETVSEDKNIAIFKDYNDKVTTLVKDGKTSDITNKCSKLFIRNNLAFCDNITNGYLINGLGESELDLSNKVIYNKQNYVENDNGNINFYEDNNKVATLSNYTLINTNKYMASKVALVRDANNIYTYYYINGKRIFDKTFKDAKQFNDYGLAIVKENSYYNLINLKGELLTNSYSSIEDHEDYYLGLNSNGSKDIINLKGEVVKTTTATVSTFFTRKDGRHFMVLEENNNQTILDFDKKTDVLTNIKGSIYLRNNTILVQIDKQVIFYAYNGKKAYEYTSMAK